MDERRIESRTPLEEPIAMEIEEIVWGQATYNHVLIQVEDE